MPNSYQRILEGLRGLKHRKEHQALQSGDIEVLQQLPVHGTLDRTTGVGSPNNRCVFPRVVSFGRRGLGTRFRRRRQCCADSWFRVNR